jgi:hypothetical protein
LDVSMVMYGPITTTAASQAASLPAPIKTDRSSQILYYGLLLPIFLAGILYLPFWPVSLSWSCRRYSIHHREQYIRSIYSIRGWGKELMHCAQSIPLIRLLSAPMHWPIKDRQASDQCNWIDHGKERKKKHIFQETLCIIV